MRPRGFLRRGGRHASFAFASPALVFAVSGALSDKPGRAASGGQRFLARTRCHRWPRADSPSRASLSLPAGFHDNVAFSGLSFPTAVRFAPDGRVFVAEKSGLIKVFDSSPTRRRPSSPTSRTEVDNYWDRGLLGLALDPNFPTQPYVYVLYTYDAAARRQPAPRWNDDCPTPPGPTTDGCVVSGQARRADGSPATSSTEPRQVLINGSGASSTPATRSAISPSGPTARSTSAGATARASPSPTTARAAAARLADAGQPLRRSAGRRRRSRDAADRRGRRPAHPELRAAAGEPGAARRHAPAGRSRDGRRPADNPLASSPTPTRGGSSPTASATRSASPSGRERASSGSATSAESAGRRSTGGSSPTGPRRRTSAGPATRAPSPNYGLLRTRA